MQFCFVILHYRTSVDTIECVESIKRLEDKSYIIIVDNASENGSIEEVEKKYGGDSDIIIIKNKKNLGFAAGNNVGYQYAKNKLKADFIAVINNDTIIESTNLISHLTEVYNKYQYHLIGPDIVSVAQNYHQNPKTDTVPDLKTSKREIWRYRALYLVSKLHIYDILKGKGPAKDKHKITNDVPHEIVNNAMLHGSFVVFSPLFIKNEDYCFRPGTFLYVEEAILYKYCVGKNYKMMFTPYVKVFHKEDSSTNSLFSATKQKREFVFKNMIKSLKVYCKILKENRD
ncbi:MAG: glycosyltransferase family 2 protein [Clostridiales bacterium]|nr:glycosyltransferase family 2 protein [Clostridiales bacterium]